MAQPERGQADERAGSDEQQRTGSHGAPGRIEPPGEEWERDREGRHRGRGAEGGRADSGDADDQRADEPRDDEDEPDAAERETRWVECQPRRRMATDPDGAGGELATQDVRQGEQPWAEQWQREQDEHR